MSKDYYKILGVQRSASKEEIKKAYKKLAKKYHPDISKEADAETKFKDINEAASILLDDTKKDHFDNYGNSDGPQGFSGFDGGSGGFNPNDFGINIDDLFEQFGFSGFSQGSRTQQKDTRIFSEVELSLDDIYFGVSKDIKIKRESKCSTCSGKGTKNNNDVKTCSTCSGSGFVIEMQRSILGAIRTQKTCPTCSGTGSEIKNPCFTCSGTGSQLKSDSIEIKIPKGIESGVSLKVSNKGSFDKSTNSYGDLYVKVFVKKSKTYEVDNSDLYMDLDVNFVQAILGDEIEFKHFDKTLSLKVPAGTQCSSILRLKGKGLPYFNYNNYGNLYIRINVQIPEKTSKEQKKILLEYAKTLKDKPFLKRMKDLFS